MIETGVSYFSSRTLRHVRADLEDMAAHNCTFVVHCFTETDLLYYRESMKEIVEATHQAGLRRLAGPVGSRRHIQRRDALRLPARRTWRRCRSVRTGRRLRPPARTIRRRDAFSSRWVRRAADTGGDGVIWDEPHFFVPFLRGERSAAWACRCAVCRERFQEPDGPCHARAPGRRGAGVSRVVAAGAADGAGRGGQAARDVESRCASRPATSSTRASRSYRRGWRGWPAAKMRRRTPSSSSA